MIIPISKNGIAVLTPREWHLIENQLNADYKIRGNFLLQTASRITEAWYLSQHPECFREENSAIFLPRVAGMGKVRCKQKERAILLSPNGVNAVKLFYSMDAKLPSYQAMDSALKRAALEADFDIRTITTKMLRKTFISWLMNYHPEWQGMIASSAGHTIDVMQYHYISFGFKKEDVKEMKDEVAGWGEG